MVRKLRWRVALIVVVVAAAVWSFMPPSEKIALGLDLRGGVHLEYRVNLDEAVQRENDVAGEMSAAAEARFRDDIVEQAIRTIERRVNALGVTEPVVARYGADGRILVQLAGLTDVERAQAVIGSTAVLELTLVEDGPFPDAAAARQRFGGALPSGLEIVAAGSVLADRVGPGNAVYVVDEDPVVTGRDLRTAQPGLDINNLPIVRFALTRDAAERFGRATGENVGRRLAIVLDGEAISVATIETRIASEGLIQGGFTSQEAQDLALTLRSGALPASLDLLYRGTVGPSLGADSIRNGVTASALGLGLVVLFMVAYYRMTGLNAVVSIVLNLVLLLGLMASLGAEMTLPGIAGFVLTIGIGVDSNVLIFERIKEELPAAKSVRAAVSAAFDRVWWTIVDTHVASLIAAAFLFQFGTGPIRGFATTLTVGLLSNVFTAVFVSRTMFELVLVRKAARVTM